MSWFNLGVTFDPNAAARLLLFQEVWALSRASVAKLVYHLKWHMDIGLAHA